MLKSKKALINSVESKTVSERPQQRCQPELYEMSDLVWILRHSRAWFYKKIKEGKFPKGIKIGRSTRWSVQEVHQWLNDLRSQGGSV